MKVILIGYRGCGKTTIGRKLADRLWMRYVDVDDLIVRHAGKSIRRIFEEDGEPRFRDIESLSLAEALAGEDLVIGLGGGTVVREANRRLIRDSGSRIIYLRCDAEVLEQRIRADTGTGDNRPALTSLGGGIEEIRLKLAEREPLYREVMTAEFDVTHQSVDDAVQRIARML